MLFTWDTKEQWNPKMLNPNGTYTGSSIENISNGKKK
jgi:hypothetical protein